MVWWGICTWLCYKFPTKFKSKRILKIDQYLMIYGQELAGVLFFWLTVYIYGPVSVSVCVSCLCLSQVGVLSKRMNGSSWYFCIGASFDLSCTLFYRKIRVSLKIRVLPSQTLSITQGLVNFATTRSSLQPVTNNAHWRSSFVDHTCDDRRAVHARSTA